MAVTGESGRFSAIDHVAVWWRVDDRPGPDHPETQQRTTVDLKNFVEADMLPVFTLIAPPAVVLLFVRYLNLRDAQSITPNPAVAGSVAVEPRDDQ